MDHNGSGHAGTLRQVLIAFVGTLALGVVFTCLSGRRYEDKPLPG